MGDRQKRIIGFALAGGFVAGTLDIAYACMFWGIKAGVPPQRILQSVAKGLVGPAAFKGGTATAALGVFLHYFIATSMAAAYYAVAHGMYRFGNTRSSTGPHTDWHCTGL